MNTAAVSSSKSNKRVVFNELLKKEEIDDEDVDRSKQNKDEEIIVEEEEEEEEEDDDDSYDDDNSDGISAIAMPEGAIAQRQSSRTHHHHNFKNKFNSWKEALLFILITFYVVDLALDIWVAVRFFTFNHPKNGWFVIFCILSPNLYAGYKSLQWYLRAHDIDPIRSPLPWIIRIAFFPCSLLLRYYDTWKFGYNSRKASRKHDKKSEVRWFSSYLVESAEVSMLRLFTIFLEDAPIAVLNLRDVLLTPLDVQKNKMEMVSVVLFKLICTMTFGVVHFLMSTKAVYHAAKMDTAQRLMTGTQWSQKPTKADWQRRGFLSLKAEICIYFWHLCAIGSRLVSYAMFVSVYQSYLWILLLIRWVINVIWIKTDAWEISMTNCVAFGGVYLFSFVPVSPKNQLLRILVYYFLTFVENITIAVLFSVSLGDNPYAAVAYVSVFGGAFLSLFFMCLYYGKLHPGRSSIISTK